MVQGVVVSLYLSYSMGMTSEEQRNENILAAAVRALNDTWLDRLDSERAAWVTESTRGGPEQPKSSDEAPAGHRLAEQGR